MNNYLLNIFDELSAGTMYLVHRNIHIYLYHFANCVHAIKIKYAELYAVHMKKTIHKTRRTY